MLDMTANEARTKRLAELGDELLAMSLDVDRLKEVRGVTRWDEAGSLSYALTLLAPARNILREMARRDCPPDVAP